MTDRELLESYRKALEQIAAFDYVCDDEGCEAHELADEALHMPVPEAEAARASAQGADTPQTGADDGLRNHQCGWDERRELLDARGIFCCYVCDLCYEAKRARYRPEIFTDPNYWTSEPVEEDDDISF